MKEEKKTGKDRVQPAVRNEAWPDERLQAFLALEPPEGLSVDYNILLKAYRGMTAELFARFLPFYLEDGRDINASLTNGSTFLDLVSSHRKSTEYADILESLGAQKRVNTE